MFSSRNAMIYALFIGTGIFACADTITIGSNTSLNVYPFNANLYAGEYQQVYSASAFSGPAEITAITFFPIPDALSNSISGDFTIYLSTTGAGVGSLSTTYANNIGANNAQFFNGVVISVTSFDGAPFLYDPSQGNLLMDMPPMRGRLFCRAFDRYRSGLQLGWNWGRDDRLPNDARRPGDNVYGNAGRHDNPGAVEPQSPIAWHRRFWARERS